MVYITVRQSPVYHQITLEELLFQSYSGPSIINDNTTNTKTYEFETASEHFTSRIDVMELVNALVRLTH